MFKRDSGANFWKSLFGSGEVSIRGEEERGNGISEAEGK